MLEDAVDCFWDIVHHDIQIDLVLLQKIKRELDGRLIGTYLITLGVESVLELDDVRVAELFHDLEFAVLIPLILVNLLDRNNFTSFSASSLKSNRKQKVEFTAIYDM